MTDKAEDRNDCLSDLRLDRLVAEELGDNERRATAGHLYCCQRCRARFNLLSAENLEFSRLALPLHGNGASVSADPPGRRQVRPRRWPVAGALAAVAAGALGIVLIQFGARDEADDLGLRSKGEAGFGYFVLRQGAVLAGQAGQPLFPGDAIQFVHTAPQAGFLAILSLDGRGKANVYYPNGPAAAPVEVGQRRPVPQSTILDASLGRETIYAFYCRSPVLIEPLRLALASKQRDFHPPKDCVIETVAYDKQGRP